MKPGTYVAIMLIMLMTAACSDQSIFWAELSSSKPATKKQVHHRQQPNGVPENMTVAQKKQRFLALLVPVATQVHAELREQYEETKRQLLAGKPTQKFTELKARFEADSEQQLLARLKPHPVSIVLAQAAMESNWATSRFFLEAKNLFGVWSFNKHEPRIAANKKRGDKTIWLKKYNSIENAVRDHYQIMARGAAYVRFRELREISSNPFRLVEALDKYSEAGKRYSKELAAIIRYNKFEQFDG